MAPVTSPGRPDSRTIWRRRVVLMAVIGLLVAIPVTILLSGDADAPPVDPVSPIEAAAPKVGPPKVDEALGVELRLPQGWTRDEKQGVVELKSKDRATRVAISAPGPAADAEQIRAEVLAGLESSYAGFDVKRKIDKAPVGGLKGEASVAVGTLPKAKGGGKQTILVTTAEGKERAYLVVIFSQQAATDSLVEAQALVNKLRFTK